MILKILNSALWGFFFYLFSWIFYGNDRKLLLKFSNQKSLYRHNICRRMNAFSIKIRSIAIRRKYCLHVQRLHLNITNLWDVGTVRKLNLFINHVYLNLAPPLTYNMADAPPNWAMLKPICSSYSQRRFSSLNQTQTMFRQKKTRFITLIWILMNSFRVLQKRLLHRGYF